MHKRNKFIQILSLIIAALLLVPLFVYADTSISSNDPNTPITAETTDPNHWPPIIQKLEDDHTHNPNDERILNSLINAYNNYGVVLAQNKQWSQAEYYISQALALNPSQQIKNNLSNVYYEQGFELYQTRNQQTSMTDEDLHNQVLQLANQAIDYNPQNANAYLLRGDLEYMDQQMWQALRDWQQVAALMPDNKDVQARLAKINREANIEENMNTIFNPYFIVKIDPSVQQNKNLDVEKLLNYAHDTVATSYQFTSLEKVPIIFYSNDEFHHTLEDSPAWVEAAYDGKIRVTVRPDQKDFTQLSSDIVHEYTHAIIAVYTDFNVPRWLNEGLAKYSEYKFGIKPRLFMLAMAYTTNNIIDWNKIDAAFLSADKQTALLAYQQSFTFVYYLLEKYDMTYIIKLLKTLGNKVDFATAVQQTFGVTLTTLQQDWRAWLDNFIVHWADAPATEDATSSY